MAPKTEKMKKAAQAFAQQAEFDEKLRKTQAAFPLLNLIYSINPATYEDVVKAYRDPETTKLLSDYIEYIFDKNSYAPDRTSRYTGPTGDVKDILLKFSGIGVTDEMRAQYGQIGQRSAGGPYTGPGGLSMKTIMAMDGNTYKLNSQIMRRLFRGLYEGENMSKVIDAYIAGDRQAMLDAMPRYIREQITNNMLDGVSFDEAGRIGRWLEEQANKLGVVEHMYGASGELAKIRKRLSNGQAVDKDSEILMPQILAIAGLWIQNALQKGKGTSPNITMATIINNAKKHQK